MDIRITFTSEEELKRLISTIETNYKIISVSKRYPNSRSKVANEYRVYVKVQV